MVTIRKWEHREGAGSEIWPASGGHQLSRETAADEHNALVDHVEELNTELDQLRRGTPNRWNWLWPLLLLAGAIALGRTWAYQAELNWSSPVGIGTVVVLVAMFWLFLHRFPNANRYVKKWLTEFLPVTVIVLVAGALAAAFLSEELAVDIPAAVWTTGIVLYTVVATFVIHAVYTTWKSLRR